MIKISAAVQALLNQNIVSAFILVKIYIKPSTIIKSITTNSYDLTMSDGVTYLSNGELISIDPPQISTNVDREIFKIVLADPNFAEGPYAESGYIGKSIEVRIGFLDRITNEPLLSISNTFITYAGRIEGTSYNVKTQEQGEATLELSCSSPMSDLDFKKSIYLSRDFIRGRNANDVCCDSIYSGSGGLQLKWGRT